MISRLLVSSTFSPCVMIPPNCGQSLSKTSSSHVNIRLKHYYGTETASAIENFKNAFIQTKLGFTMSHSLGYLGGVAKVTAGTRAYSISGVSCAHKISDLSKEHNASSISMSKVARLLEEKLLAEEEALRLQKELIQAKFEAIKAQTEVILAKKEDYEHRIIALDKEVALKCAEYCQISTPRSLLENFEDRFKNPQLPPGQEKRVVWWERAFEWDTTFVENLLEKGLKKEDVPQIASRLYDSLSKHVHGKSPTLELNSQGEIVITVASLTPEEKLLYECIAENYNFSVSFSMSSPPK